jgi:tRNA 2-thiouridine synthesizing protein A
MPQLLDARGLLCPLPALKARRALAALAPGDTLVVLATDPEAPVDVGALAAEGGHGFEVAREADGWRLTLTKANVNCAG